MRKCQECNHTKIESKFTMVTVFPSEIDQPKVTWVCRDCVYKIGRDYIRKTFREQVIEEVKL